MAAAVLVAPHEAHNEEYSKARCDLERAYARLAQTRELRLGAEEAPAQPTPVPTERAIPPGPQEEPAQPTPVPTMPVIHETEKQYLGFPDPLLDGIPRTIGWQWQSEAKGGPVFAIIVRSAMGGLKVQERFPLTENGWRNAWHALAESDPVAARKVAARLAARAAEVTTAPDPKEAPAQPITAPPVPSAAAKATVRPHWGMAIWALVLLWPAGIVAIIFANLTRNSLKVGDDVTARKHSSQVKIWFWISLVGAVVVFILIVAASANPNPPPPPTYR